MDTSILILFIPTFFFVSATPGLCMTLAMSLGMTIGVRRSLWMIIGELTGVALVSLSALIGVATILLAHPHWFLLLKSLGGAYLLYLGIQMWFSRGKMALSNHFTAPCEISPWSLMSQGFVTAIANPKGWAFMISLLPPFINPNYPLHPQATVLIAIILCFEFICLLLYATGGRTLRNLLQKSGNVIIMNRVAGGLMMLVALWLVVS